jgi:hypothetical protein
MHFLRLQYSYQITGISSYRYFPSGYTVKNMAIQVISRDSGLMISTMRGIEEKAPLIPVNGISRHWIEKYLRRKRDLLLEALSKDYAPKCRKRETWYGRKCADYCEVNEICTTIDGKEGK